MLKSFLFFGLALSSCSTKEPAAETGILDPGPPDPSDTDDTDDTDTDDTEEPVITGGISGMIYVQLYMDDENGDREFISWKDAYSGAFCPEGRNINGFEILQSRTWNIDRAAVRVCFGDLV